MHNLLKHAKNRRIVAINMLMVQKKSLQATQAFPKVVFCTGIVLRSLYVLSANFSRIMRTSRVRASLFALFKDMMH